ncbi:glycosyltransferase family 2 protein [Amphritea japonica]|uniref:Glycosyl transferase family 11 n=1 Tax=Amphritea japonica ATCC BAA-1530 TaxID=1278309 RepID=A0A7R6PEB0_9GAMM|nr:glycosyltransferase [Amphritea japonica]BBB24807.1 glycosyl transferase family 11 [Amphritea japonica ATCC BAA-1530]
MSDFPLVSVIIPVYNGEKYLLESLESVLHQTYPNIEIIVVDDCSTDNGAGLIAALDADNIIVLRNDTNSGVSASRNKAIRSAKGKYIAFMDADDVSLPHRIECQVNFLEDNSEFGLLSSAYQTFEEDLLSGKKSLKQLPCNPDEIAAQLLFQCVICCPAAMLRGSLVQEHELYFDESLSMCEDWDLWYRVSQVSRVSNVEDVLVYYRKHSNNSSRKRTEMYRSKIRLIQRSFRDYGGCVDSLFNGDLYIKSDPAFGLFVEQVEQLANNNRIEKWFGDKEAVKACAYVLYEIYKTNVDVLGNSAYDHLRKSWLYQYMDISRKHRIKYYLRSKFSG